MMNALIEELLAVNNKVNPNFAVVDIIMDNKNNEKYFLLVESSRLSSIICESSLMDCESTLMITVSDSNSVRTLELCCSSQRKDKNQINKQ